MRVGVNGNPRAAVTIVDVQTVPAREIGRLHMRYLATPFVGRPGHKLLELYYQALTNAPSTFGCAALIDGCVAGFACAIHIQGAVYRELLARSWIRLLGWSFAEILLCPGMIVRLPMRLIPSRKETNNWQRPDTWADWYTCRPLVVAEEYRQYGVADALTECLIAEAKKRQVKGLIGVVQPANGPSRVIHIRHGFREVWRDEERIVFAKEM